MADFGPAFFQVLKHEGGYADDPHDRGGETYRGISRKAHPDWHGWERIDRYRMADLFPSVLDSDHALKGMVQDFYRQEYWKPINGDKLENQWLAEFMFDYAVHAGASAAIKQLQRALNLFNKVGSVWPDAKVDGVMGPKTLSSIKSYYVWNGEAPLRKAVIGLRIAHYVEIVEKHEQDERFIRGWLNRIRLR